MMFHDLIDGAPPSSKGCRCASLSQRQEVYDMFQVLNDPEARRCHEIALDANASPGLRRAAASMAFRSRASHAYEMSFSDALNPLHWRAIASAEATLVAPGSASLPSRSAARLSQELEASLHQVYFGPDISDLPAEHLPPAFEAEHRSHPWSADLLQLVSGQSLLGSVRCLQQPALPAAGPPQHTARAPEASAETSDDTKQSCHQHDQNVTNGECSPDNSSSCLRSREPQWSAWGLPQLRTLESLWKQAAIDGLGSGARSAGQPGGPAVLELVFSVSGQDQARPPTRLMSAARASPPAVCQMMGVIQVGDGEAGGWVEVQCPVSRQVWGFVLGDMVTDADGLHTHTIMTHGTPGVLHTAIFSMAARKVVFKATRTWLPDPQYWFVPPRTEDYQSGGWYIEWAGHTQASRPGWLHPGVACIILGMQALDVERGQGPWWLQPRRHAELCAR